MLLGHILSILGRFLIFAMTVRFWMMKSFLESSSGNSDSGRDVSAGKLVLDAAVNVYVVLVVSKHRAYDS